MKALIVWASGSQTMTLEVLSVCPPSQGCLAYMLMRKDGVTYLEPAAVRSVSTHYPEEPNAENQAR